MLHGAPSFLSFGYFLGLAAATIYIGAHKSLSRNKATSVGLGLKEGLIAPFYASGVLFLMYCIIKYLPDLDLKAFIEPVFAYIGCSAIIACSSPMFKQLAEGAGFDSNKFNVTVPLPKFLLEDDDKEREGEVEEGLEASAGAGGGWKDQKIDLAYTDFVAVALGVALVAIDYTGHHNVFTANNLIACAITVEILSAVGLSSFRVAALLLGGLLVYDVVWVFLSPNFAGGNVMMTVATSAAFSGPGRLLFPRPLGSIGEAGSFPFSLLGLGDVAIPGMLACLSLRYDASRSAGIAARAEAAGRALQTSFLSMDNPTDHEAMKASAVAAEAAYDMVADAQDAEKAAGGGTLSDLTEAVLQSRPYFAAALSAYVFGLGLAFVANSVTHMGQPALLYIVPSMLGTVAAMAVVRGELQSVLRFTHKANTVSDILRDASKPSDKSRTN